MHALKSVNKVSWPSLRLELGSCLTLIHAPRLGTATKQRETRWLCVVPKTAWVYTSVLNPSSPVTKSHIRLKGGEWAKLKLYQKLDQKRLLPCKQPSMDLPPLKNGMRGWQLTPHEPSDLPAYWGQIFLSVYHPNQVFDWTSVRFLLDSNPCS